MSTLRSGQTPQIEIIRRENVAQDEINLREVLSILWGRRLLILAVAVVCAGAALGAAFLVAKQYTASVLLSPVAGDSGGLGGGADSLLSQYKGLASLAGLSINGNSKRAESIALLQSNVIAQQFITNGRLLPILYPQKWDVRAQGWKAGKKAPTMWEATQFFKKTCDVTENPRTGLVSLTVKWKRPELAAQWANGLVALTNDYARQKAIDESARDIEFLNGQAQKTTLVEERTAIFALLQSVLNKRMLAEGTTEYALKVIDPALAPEKPSFPKRTLWAIVGFLGGILLACGYALARSSPARS